MSKTASHNSANSTTTVPDWDELPCVQYGFPDDKGPTRTPKLRTIFEPIPEDAETASPVYILSRDQYERQEQFESGYEVAGEVTSIATELQDECEADDDVLYPVHIESDVYREEGPDTLIEWFREFVEDYLEAPFEACTLYFSGRRSIHVHVPRFVRGENDRERFKELAESFCDETGAELDCGLYYAKRLFRLPGVEHAKTGLRKVEIEPEWEHDRIVREASKAGSAIPESYETVLRNVFTTQPSLTVNTPQTTVEPPLDLFHVLDSDETMLEFEETEVETPLIEQEQYPDDPADAITWVQYNAKEFSPYALASGNGRSVAVVQVKGTPFARKEIRNGATLIPAYFYGVRGCAGKQFTMADKHAPLQLSKADYGKWVKQGFEPGDHLVIIGGQSRSSILLRVEPGQATDASNLLTKEEGSRKTALHYLEKEGYDVGKAGNSGKTTTTKRAGTRDRCDHVPPVRNPTTPAARFQQQAEQEGIKTLSHYERWRLACRVLKWGWEPAWGWFKEQFSSAFKPDVTREQFMSVIEAFPEDYDHVEVPEKPA